MLFHQATWVSTTSDSTAADIGAPGIPVLNPIQSGTSRISRGSKPLAGLRFFQPATSGGNMTQPISGLNANHQAECIVLRYSFTSNLHCEPSEPHAVSKHGRDLCLLGG